MRDVGVDKQGSRSGDYKVLQSLGKVEGVFDLITMFEVVEHLKPDELSGALDKIESLLDVGGKVIISTPNPDCLFQAIFFWRTFNHIRPYPVSVVTEQLAKRGLKTISVKKAKYCLHPFRMLTALITMTELNTRNIIIAKK